MHKVSLFWHRKYGLEDDTIDFIGHSLALHSDDSYLDKPAIDFVKKMKVKIVFLHTLVLMLTNVSYVSFTDGYLICK